MHKAEEYQKLGLSAQVQHELWEAQRIDPTIIRDPRYQTLFGSAAAHDELEQSLRKPLRIGAGILLTNTAVGALLIVALLATGQASDISRGDIIGPIISASIGVNLWRLKRPWMRYTMIWAGLGLLWWGGVALAEGDWLSLVMQIAFSGSLLLLLAGTPTRGRTIAAVVLFGIGYMGVLFGVLALLALAALIGGP